jgi:hypothetical protein
MSVNSANNRRQTAYSMMLITLLAGLLGFLFQLIPDGTMLTFLVGVGAIGGLSGSTKTFDERENQLLWKSYSTAFEYLFVIVYLAFTLVVFSNWLHVATGMVAFINEHWIGLVASTMCTLLGIVGLRNFRAVE